LERAITCRVQRLACACRVSLSVTGPDLPGVAAGSAVANTAATSPRPSPTSVGAIPVDNAGNTSVRSTRPVEADSV
jgi:hypothetical protein